MEELPADLMTASFYQPVLLHLKIPSDHLNLLKYALPNIVSSITNSLTLSKKALMDANSTIIYYTDLNFQVNSKIPQRRISIKQHSGCVEYIIKRNDMPKGSTVTNIITNTFRSNDCQLKGIVFILGM